MLRTCNRRHTTSLHDDALTYQHRATNPEKSEATHRNPISHCIEVCARNTSVDPMWYSLILLTPDWWKQQVHKFMTYALLDDQSDTCFIKQTAVDKLGVSGPELHLKLSTVLAQQTIWCIRKATYTREIIPARHSQILRPETARKWPHFKEVADHLMPYND